MNISTFIKDFITLKGNVYTYLNSVFNNNSNLDINSIISIFKTIIDNIFLELESIVTLGVKKSLESLYPIKNIDFTITNINYFTPYNNSHIIISSVTPNLPKIIKYSNGKYDFIPIKAINFKLVGNYIPNKKNIRNTISIFSNYMDNEINKITYNYTILKINDVIELKKLLEENINRDSNIVNFEIHQQKFGIKFGSYYVLLEHRRKLTDSIYTKYYYNFNGASRYHYQKFLKQIGPIIDADDL